MLAGQQEMAHERRMLLGAVASVLFLFGIIPASGQSTSWDDRLGCYHGCSTKVLQQCTCVSPPLPAPTETPYNCSIKMQSYSAYNDSTEVCPSDQSLPGYVELNGRRFWTSGWCLPGLPNLRGVNTLIVDPNECTPLDFRNFDTHLYVDSTQDLVEYLSVVHQGAVIVSYTGDEATRSLSSALRRLRAVGVHVDDVTYRGNFAFIIQIGYPWKTTYVKTSSQLNSQLQVTVTDAFRSTAHQRVGPVRYYLVAATGMAEQLRTFQLHQTDAVFS